MTKRVVVGALFGALLVWTTGCSSECVDQFDCASKKGQAAQGQQWTCVNNKCEQSSIPPPADAGEDGGVTPPPEDGGMDAGTDAGMDAGTDGGTDAGMDAGAGVAQGGACTASGDCMPGLRCEGTTDKTCQPLHIAMTVAGASGGPSQAVAVRYNNTDPGAVVSIGSSTSLASSSPRWSPDGSRVAFVEAVSGGGTELVTLTVPPATATRTPLVSSTDASTDIFRYLEWEPSDTLVWSRKSGAAYSGISGIPGAGGTVVSLTESGVMPDWAADGKTFVYAFGNPVLAGSGIYVGGPNMSPAAIAGAEQGTEPYTNRANNQILFLKPNSGAPNNQPEDHNTELFSIAQSGGTANLVASLSTPQDVTGGKLFSYIAYPAWAHAGTWAAYVRTYFFIATGSTTPVLCGNAGAQCGSQAVNDIFLQRMDPANGKPSGDPVAVVPGGTLPSFSPDGHFLAYVRGKRLYVQEIDPVAGTTVGNPTAHQETTDVLTNLGDDYRPRWQPR